MYFYLRSFRVTLVQYCSFWGFLPAFLRSWNISKDVSVWSFVCLQKLIVQLLIIMTLIITGATARSLKWAIFIAFQLEFCIEKEDCHMTSWDKWYAGKSVKCEVNMTALLFQNAVRIRSLPTEHKFGLSWKPDYKCVVKEIQFQVNLNLLSGGLI